MAVYLRNKLKIIIFVLSKNKVIFMSNEQFKKDLLVMRMMIKKKLDELVYIGKETGVMNQKAIDKLLDRLNNIDKVLKELEEKE